MAMGVLGQLGASITGNIETARLLIYDYRNTAQQTQEKLSTEAINTLAPGSDALGEALTDARMTGLSEMADYRRGAATSEYMKGFRRINDTGDPTLFDFNDPVKTKTFLVRFNPSKIQIYSSSLPVKKPDAQGGEPVHDSTVKGTLSMTVTLFFDEMNMYDSFMVDKFTMGASVSGAMNIASSIAKNTGLKKWSVQDEVEGLISALRNPYTRNVSFRWADFTFTGQLSTVNAQYKMFNTTGVPVRAEVLLRIQHEMDDSALISWYTDYDNAMMGESTNLTKASQYVGNVLNFNL